MLLPDVNVLIHAHREQDEQHPAHRVWLTELVNGSSSFAVSELVLSAFVRIVTNTRVYQDPTPLREALAFVDDIVNSPACTRLRPGPRHLTIFTDLCRAVKVTGNVVPDAYHAALAIEHGCTWVTNDRGFARFPGLRWSTPFAA